MDDMAQQDPHLVLPVVATPDLYRDRTADLLAEVCTPYAQAQPGDIISVCYDGKLHKGGGVLGYPITQVLRINDDAPTYRPEITQFVSLPEAQQEKIALACMRLQCNGLNPMAVEMLASRLDPDVGEDFYYNFLLMPKLALLHAENPLEEVFEGIHHGEPREQEQVDDAFLLCIPRDCSSNHQLLPLEPDLRSVVDLINTTFPIMNDEGDAAIPLDLPDLSPLYSGDLANTP